MDGRRETVGARSGPAFLTRNRPAKAGLSRRLPESGRACVGLRREAVVAARGRAPAGPARGRALVGGAACEQGWKTLTRGGHWPLFTRRPQRLRCGLVEQVVEPRVAVNCSRVQPADPRVLVHGGPRKRPPATAAYSSRGRNSSGRGRAASVSAGRGLPLTPTRAWRPACSSCSATSSGPWCPRTPAAADDHPHALADQTRRHRVRVRVDHHRVVGLDRSEQVPQLPERRPPRTGTQARRFRAKRSTGGL